MTLTNTTKIVSFDGDGTTDDFPFTINYAKKSQIKVYLDDVLWVEGTNYSLTDPGTSGVLTALAGHIPQVGDKLYIMLDMSSDIDQQTDFPNASTYEAVIDKLTRVCLYQERLLDRCIRTAETSSQAPTFPEGVANGYIKFTSDGLTLEANTSGVTDWLSGDGAPSSSLGDNGDFYYDTTNSAVYGPKSSGSWGSAVSLVGPQGPQGIQGPQGASGSGTGDMLASIYDPSDNMEELVGLTATQTLTNKTLTQPVLDLYSEDDPQQTEDGRIIYDTLNNRITVGNGTSRNWFSADSVVKDRGVHTGTQTLSTISDAGNLAALDTVGSSEIDSNAITTAKIADDAVTLAKIGNVLGPILLGRNNASSGILELLDAAAVRTMLNVEDGATAGSGVPAVIASTTSQRSISSSTFTDTNLTVTITPSSTSSKILVLAFHNQIQMNGAEFGDDCEIRLAKGTTQLALNDYSDDTPIRFFAALAYIDSPASTAAQTYKTQARRISSGTTIVMQNESTISYMIAMEVA